VTSRYPQIRATLTRIEALKVEDWTKP